MSRRQVAQESRGPGRPPRAEEPSTRFIGFHVTEREWLKIRRLAAENDQTPGTLSRDLTLDAAEEHAEALGGLPDFLKDNFRPRSS